VAKVLRRRLRRKKPVVVKYKPYPVYPFPNLRAIRRRASPKRIIEYNAWTKGPGGDGQLGWTAVFYGLFVIRQMRKHRGPQHVSIDRLKPGEGLVIRTIPPPTKAERRAARRG
jgi:hypothetical protein